MKKITDVHNYHETNLSDLNMSKPILTKLKNFSVLYNSAWYGNMLRNVILPLTQGKVTVKNLSNVHIVHNDQEYTIRVDQFYAGRVTDTDGNNINTKGKTKEQIEVMLQEDMDKTIQHLKDAYDRFMNAGVDLYKKLTDCNELGDALTLSNSFLRDGVNVIAVKKEDGMHYKFPVNGKLYETADPDELLIFLGSLANVFILNRGVPDARWFNDNKDEGFPF